MADISFKRPEQEMEEVRKLQRNVIGRTDYARVTCILMLILDFSPDLVAQGLGIDVATVCLSVQESLRPRKNGQSFGRSL